MNLGASAVVLRPRSVSEVMDLACRFTFARSLGLYVKLWMVFVLPFYVAVVALTYLLDLEWWVVWLIAFPITIWTQAPFTIAASRVMFGEQPTVRVVMQAFWARIGSYTGAILLKFLYVSLGVPLFCIGSLFIAPSGVLVSEVSLLEGAKATEAWGRSRRIVQQRSSDSFLALLALLSATAAFTVGFDLFGQALVNDILQLGKPFGELFEEGFTPYAVAGLLLAAPYVATARFLHYIDTRTRADGWDIQVKFMAIVAKHEETKQLKTPSDTEARA